MQTAIGQMQEHNDAYPPAYGCSCVLGIYRRGSTSI